MSLLLLLAACSGGPSVIVVGAGPAGLAAAEAAARSGARVSVLEADSEPGGAARWAAAITWVPTEAEADEWRREAGARSVARERYLDRVVPDFVDGLGLGFQPVPDPSGSGAQLVAPAGGGRAVVRVLVERARGAGVGLRMGCPVAAVSREEEGWQVDAGPCGAMQADRLILTTGGFMGDIPEARTRLGLADAQLIRSAPERADGVGLELAAAAGAQVPDRLPGVVYAHAVPHPRAADRALMVVQSPPDTVVVDAAGVPQDGLLAVRGGSGRTLLSLPGQQAWLIGTASGLGRVGAMPMDGRPVPLAEVARVHGARAHDLAALERRLGMADGALQALAFAAGAAPSAERPLPPRGPFIAVPLRPTPAKSLGGVRVDGEGRARTAAGEVVPYLYAAGELAGFGGAHAASPRDSTMIAGAVLDGQVAGAAAATDP